MCTTTALKNKVSFFKRLNKAKPPLREIPVLLSDKYDLPSLGKQEIKMLTRDEIKALISYGTHSPSQGDPGGYLEQYETGKYMYRKTRAGLVADYDENEIYRTFKRVLQELNQELSRRV